MTDGTDAGRDPAAEHQLGRLTARLDAAKARADHFAAAYDELRSRKVVRLALRAAALARPLFRLLRRRRGAPPPPPAAPVAPGGWPAPLLGATRLARLASVPPPTVVVPVHDAPEAVARCLEAVVRNTTRPARLLIVDDASSDPRIPGILGRYAGRPEVTVTRTDTNLGFVGAANLGMASAAGDVVLLNSDTEVPPGWLQNLMAAAYHDDAVGSATALSNNAGAFSAPVAGVANPLPAGAEADDVGRLVARHSHRRWPATPTANGFCAYLRRDMLDVVGAFDAASFPRGYGEENDLSRRAAAAGWRHVVDDATYVVHERGASFGPERQALAAAGAAKLAELHPGYAAAAAEFAASPAMAAAREDVAAAVRAPGGAAAPVRRRVLYVLHGSGGGTRHATDDLIQALGADHEALLLASDGATLRLTGAGGATLPLDPPIEPTHAARADYQEAVAAVLLRHAVELVHVRHLMHHTFDLPWVASVLGIPVVLSIHDFYLACPTVHLVDDRGAFCAGTCTPGDGICPVPAPWLAPVPHLKHAWVHTWRERARRALHAADALVTTSESARAVLLRSFPELASARLEIIEHGRDLAARAPAAAPTPGERVRVLVPGNLEPHKGAGFLRALLAADRAGRLDVHLLGRVAPGDRALGTWHGEYARDEFADRVAAIGPSFIGLFSVGGETYSHALTESWAAGVPVVATDVAALGERVRRHGGGWLVDPADPQGALATILAAADDPAAYERAAGAIAALRLPTTAEMGDRYRELYRDVLRRRRVFSG